MRRMTNFAAGFLLGALAWAGFAQDGGVPSHLKRYDSPYYEIYSDLEPDRVKEAALRMTRMAEEYHARTAEFSGEIREKFQFWLFREAADYYAAGAPRGSGGVYMSSRRRLMGIAGAEPREGTWHVIQHEGFHQFADAVIRGELPIWLNEGLAEYFGEGLFTGDGFVTGLMPPGRVVRIQESIKGGKFKSIQNMMLMTHQTWNAALTGGGGAAANYDQAWSMVHFLAHAEEGKYQKAMTTFVLEIGRGKPWDRAWLSSFGTAEGFEKKWREWWLSQPRHPTPELYAKTCVMTFASYLGRAKSQKQTFDTFEEFFSAAKEGSVKVPEKGDDWLPAGLLGFAVMLRERAVKDIDFALGKDPRGPQVVATTQDGTRIVSTYDGRARLGRTKVEIDDMVPVIAKAEALLKEQKKQDARKLLMEAIKRNPRSPVVEQARKMLQGIK